MRVLGIETSCDETGVALYSTRDGLLAQRLHSQVQMHERYGGVVPELASRDHVQRLAPMIEATLADAGLDFDAIDGIAYTEGPGLAGALLVGAALARSLAFALDRPAIGVHHLEGHLVAPLLADRPPAFPFVALLVSGGHTQLLEARALGDYRLLGDTVDDAAGEAFDKSAKLLGLGYPGGPALAALAAQAPAQAPADAVDRGSRFRLPRPKLRDADLDFSFSGLKTAVLTRLRKGVAASDRPAFAREIEQAITDVLVAKARGCHRTNRADATGDRRRRQRQYRTAAQARLRGRATAADPSRIRGVLSAARAVHRQRRDDRARRGAAAGGGCRATVARLRCPTALAAGIALCSLSTGHGEIEPCATSSGPRP